MSDLNAITYDDQASGRSAFDALSEMQKMQVLTLEDAALAYQDEKGKVKVKQTLVNQHTGSLATWGLFWGLATALLVAKATPDKALPELEKFGGHVYQTSLSIEDEEKLRKILEHENVKEAADDNLDVE